MLDSTWGNKIFLRRFNCAEAVNFALNRWIEIGRKAKPCKCTRDSVKIDLNYFCENLKENKSFSKSND